MDATDRPNSIDWNRIVTDEHIMTNQISNEEQGLQSKRTSSERIREAQRPIDIGFREGRT